MDTSVRIEQRRSTGRVHWLDWLRVLALAGVFVFHTSRPFDSGYWHVEDGVQSELLAGVQMWVASWGLAFFFLVAGAGTALALRWRSAGQFLAERTARLLAPLVVAWAVLGPVQMWLEEQSHGTSDDSLLQVAGRYLADPFGHPPLVLSQAYHLWFVVFLIEFSVLGLPLFLWYAGPTGRRLAEQLGRLGAHRAGVLSLGLLVVAVTAATSQVLFDEGHGWGEFCYFFAFFVLGHVVMADPRLVAGVRAAVGPAAVSAVVATGTLLLLDPWTYVDGDWNGDGWSARVVVVFGLLAAQAWGWVIVVWSLGLRAAAFRRPLPQPVADSAMPFFLLHQPVILAVAFFVVGWTAATGVKWLAILVASLVLCAALAWGLSRLPVASTLLGVKPPARKELQP